MSLLDSSEFEQAYKKVRATLAHELDIDESQITLKKSLGQLRGEPLDVLEILYELRINSQRVVGHEGPSEFGKKILHAMGTFYDASGKKDLGNHYHRIAQVQTKDGLLELTVRDLVNFEMINQNPEEAVRYAPQLKVRGEAA